jgi:hypothetical protein
MTPIVELRGSFAPSKSVPFPCLIGRASIPKNSFSRLCSYFTLFSRNRIVGARGWAL